MELCTPQTISNVFQIKCFNPNPHFLHSRPSLLPERFTFFRRNSGLLRPVTPLLRATTSEEKNTIIDEQQERPSGVITIDKSPSDEQNGAFETKLAEVAEEETPTGEQTLNFEFLEALNVKLDSEDTYPLLIYGSGALVTVWLASAVIGAIDSVPVIPKVLELVGLGYTIWFCSRYLVFKENREELFAKIEEVKQQIIGSSDD